MAVAKKTRGRIWENQETLLLLQKWGGRKYTNEVNILYQKEAYMARNKWFYSSGRLRRPWWRCLQNKSTKISKCVSLLQRRMREDRKRDSKEEAGVFRRSRWISPKKTMYQTEGCGKFFKIIIEADNEEEDNEKIENDEPNEELPSFSGGTSVSSNNKTAGKFPQPNKGECLTGELWKLSLIGGSDNRPRKCFNIDPYVVYNL